MTELAPLLSLPAGLAWAGLAVFLRVAAMMAVLPEKKKKSLSVRVRLLLSIMLSVAVLPAAAPDLDLPAPGLPGLVRLLGTETVSGLFLGLLLRLFIIAIQTAGAIAAQSTSLAQIMGQAGADPLPAMGHILTVAALALLMATGFHVKVAAFILLSYEFLPANRFPDPAALADAGRSQVAGSFALAFSLAAPFVILSVLYNLTLGVINKAMPQLMVAFVGAPLITLGSVALLMVSAPVMLVAWLDMVERFLANPLG